jgi:hypothetical protein
MSILIASLDSLSRQYINCLSLPSLFRCSNLKCKVISFRLVKFLAFVGSRSFEDCWMSWIISNLWTFFKLINGTCLRVLTLTRKTYAYNWSVAMTKGKFSSSYPWHSCIFQQTYAVWIGSHLIWLKSFPPLNVALWPAPPGCI